MKQLRGRVLSLTLLLVFLAVPCCASTSHYLGYQASRAVPTPRQEAAFVSSCGHCRKKPLHASSFSLSPRSTVLCNLFFNSRRRKDYWKVPQSVLDELGQTPVSFPRHIGLEYEGRNAKEQDRKCVVVRNLEISDLPTVVPIIVKEFGSGDPITSLDEIPWTDLINDQASLQQISDRLFFGPLVQIALELKIQRQQAGDDPSKVNIKPDDTVLCLEADGKVVGIVELSLQPPDAERNPPPVPIPMWIKQLLSTVRGLPKPDGWVTNLLIDEPYRGLGYSKVLMMAAEGLARSWDCDAIYLHVDADAGSGKVAQELYRGLGYEPVTEHRVNRKYDWMGPEMLNSGLYEVDGVPLLFLRKDVTTPP